MRIEVHPKPDGMQHINLMFCEEEEEPEDLWVLSQLEAFSVPPKRVLLWERDGREYRVMQYGQCVLGQTLFPFEKHKAIVDKIRATCKEELARTEMEKSALNELISRAALELHQEARFTVDLNSELTIDIDEAKARECLLRWLEEGNAAAA